MPEPSSVELSDETSNAESSGGLRHRLFGVKLASGSRLDLFLSTPQEPAPPKRWAREVLSTRTLLIASLAIYLLVRLVGLADWPIYFFTDEAVQIVMAADFIHANLRNYDNELLPTFFSNGPAFNLSSVSVYVQVLPYLLFGKSVYVTRLVSMLFSALGAWFVALSLKHGFKASRPWLGILLLSSAPAWFLHSRTAFETVEMSAFFAGFIYCYLRYRLNEPRYLYGAVIFGSLVFYTYGPGQLIITVAGLSLFLIDIRYHWLQRRWVCRGFLLLLTLALPYLRYYLEHSGSTMQQLAQRAPYWAENIPLAEKFDRYFSEYLGAFNPLYWFIPNDLDLNRHVMKDYGHLFLLTSPILVIGSFLMLRRIRKPEYRILLLALLTAPTGGALVQVGITRLLCMLIPMILLMSLGAEWCLERMQDLARKRLAWQGGATVLSGMVFSGLAILNLGMLSDALRNGPLWYQDYTLYGMQYGSRQLFPAAIEYLKFYPGTRLLVSPSWTNGTGEVKRFFVPDELPISLGSVEGHLFRRQPLDDYLVFVMMPNEYEKMLASGKFKDIKVDQTLPYPNGEPGFYFVRLRYVDNIDAIFKAESQQRRQLQEAYLLVNEVPTHIQYSMLDIGTIDELFDGSENTLTRTIEANPYIIDLIFDTPVSLAGLNLFVGSTKIGIAAQVEGPDGSKNEFLVSKHTTVIDPIIDLDFEVVYTVQRIHLEIRDLTQNEPGNVHVWEITFKQRETP